MLEQDKIFFVSGVWVFDLIVIEAGITRRKWMRISADLIRQKLRTLDSGNVKDSPRIYQKNCYYWLALCLCFGKMELHRNTVFTEAFEVN